MTAPRTIVLLRLLLLAIVCWLVFSPLAALIYGMLRTGTPGDPEARFTLVNLRTIYLGVFSGGQWQQALVESLLLAAVVSLIAVALGTLFAWLIVRTDLPLPRFFEIALIMPLFYSSLIELIGWTMLASPRSGYINVAWRSLTGSRSSLVDVYTVPGIIFVMSTQFIPYVLLVSVGQMKSMDRTLEEASAISGARLWTSMRTVTLPILLPGLAAAGMYVFVLCMEMFTVPGLLGANIPLRTVAWSVYQKVVGFTSDLPLAAAGGTLLLLVAALALVLYRYLTRMAQRFVTTTGREARPARLALGRYRLPVFGLCIIFVLLTSLLPLGAVILRSLMRVRVDTIGTLSLDNYRELFSEAYFFSAVRNSFVLAFTSATLCAALGVALAMWKVLHPDRTIRICDYLISIPIALPGIVLGVGLLWTYVATPLYLTLGILLLAMVTRFTGIALQVGAAGLMQIHRSLEEAAGVAGASVLRARWSITLPLLRPVIASLWLLVFLLSARELSTSFMLYGIGTETMPIQTWKYLSDGLYGTASAMAVVQVFAILAVLGLYRAFIGSDIKLSRHAFPASEATT